MTMTVEIFTSGGCPRCAKAVRLLQRVSESLGHQQLILWRVDVVQEIDYAVALGIVSVPSIAIDGRLVFSSLPAEKALRNALIQSVGAGLRNTGNSVDSEGMLI